MSTIVFTTLYHSVMELQHSYNIIVLEKIDLSNAISSFIVSTVMQYKKGALTNLLIIIIEIEN